MLLFVLQELFVTTAKKFKQDIDKVLLLQKKERKKKKGKKKMEIIISGSERKEKRAQEKCLVGE